MHQNIMRFLLLALLGLWVAACGSSDDKSKDDADDSDSSTVPPGGWDTEPDPYHGDDDVLKTDDYSAIPGGIDVKDAPMFVTLGFDDNAFADGVNWITDFLRKKKNADGTPARISFYMTTGHVSDDPEVFSMYAEPRANADIAAVVDSWRTAYEDGHEVGNHTHHHFNGFPKWETGKTDDDVFTVEQWADEMERANHYLSEDPDGPGVPASEVTGFRTPFLAYSDMTMAAAAQVGFDYDCSIEDGWQGSMNGTNFPWPYDLKDGSPGDNYSYTWGNLKRDPVGSHPGLWEMPVLPMIAPPDYRVAEYGLPTGFRAMCKSRVSYFSTEDGKITGFDYNMWEHTENFSLTGDEVLAVLKYSLDLRLKGNRAPFMLGVHTDEYTDENPYFKPRNSTVADRRKAIEDFLDYALSKKEVRVVPVRDILAWVKAQKGADNTDPVDTETDPVDTETDPVGTDTDPVDTDTDGTDTE